MKIYTYKARRVEDRIPEDLMTELQSIKWAVVGFSEMQRRETKLIEIIITYSATEVSRMIFQQSRILVEITCC